MAERWWVEEEHRAALEARAPLDVAAWMQPAADRRVLSSDRQSAAVCWDGETPLLVKWRAPIPGRKAKTLLRPSRERAEAEAMARAAALGIPCPTAWAVGERRRLGVLEGSVLIRPFDEHARTVDEALRHDPQVHVVAAAALRRWHDLGFRHGDCYPKNVLVGGAREEPRPIGCPKARFVAPGTALDEARLKDLAQWAVGSAGASVLGDPFAFLAVYGERDGAVDAGAGSAAFPPYEQFLERITPFYEAILAKKAERLRTRPEREPDGPPAPTPLSP